MKISSEIIRFMATSLNALLYFLITTQLFLFLTQCGGKQIWSGEFKNFKEYESVSIILQNNLQFEQMYVEATITAKSLPLTSMTQFLILVAEPLIKLPLRINLWPHESQMRDNLDKRIYFDEEGYGTLRWYQMIQVENPYSGAWTIGAYNLKSSFNDEFTILIRVFSVQSNSNFYPENCNLLKSGGKNSISNLQRCNCGIGFIGKTCYFEAPLIAFSDKIDIELKPLQWQMRAFNGSSLESPTFSLFLQGSISHSRLSAIYGAASENSVPYFSLNSYEISQNNSSSEWAEYPLIDSKMQSVFNQTFLNQQSLIYPYKDPNYSQVLILGFYNESPQESIYFSLLLKEVNDKDQKDDTLGTTISIIFIICGCSVLFCVIPFSYFCVRKYRLSKNYSLELLSSQQRIDRQNEEQNEQQNRNNLQIIPPLTSSRPFGQGPPSSSRSGNIDEVIIPSTRRNENINPNELNNAQGAQTKIIKKIVPITKDTINKFMPLQSYENILLIYPNLQEECIECMVCLEGFTEKTECRLSPCFHLFHSECLLQWFTKHSTCPYCRAPCNRKGILRQQHTPQNNEYVKRLKADSDKGYFSDRNINREVKVQVEEINLNKTSSNDKEIQSQNQIAMSYQGISDTNIQSHNNFQKDEVDDTKCNTNNKKHYFGIFNKKKQHQDELLQKNKMNSSDYCMKKPSSLISEQLNMTSLQASKQLKTEQVDKNPHIQEKSSIEELQSEFHISQSPTSSALSTIQLQQINNSSVRLKQFSVFQQKKQSVSNQKEDSILKKTNNQQLLLPNKNMKEEQLSNFDYSNLRINENNGVFSQIQSNNSSFNGLYQEEQNKESKSKQASQDIMREAWKLSPKLNYSPQSPFQEGNLKGVQVVNQLIMLDQQEDEVYDAQSRKNQSNKANNSQKHNLFQQPSNLPKRIEDEENQSILDQLAPS